MFVLKLLSKVLRRVSVVKLVSMHAWSCAKRDCYAHAYELRRFSIKVLAKRASHCHATDLIASVLRLESLLLLTYSTWLDLTTSSTYSGTQQASIPHADFLGTNRDAGKVCCGGAAVARTYASKHRAPRLAVAAG